MSRDNEEGRSAEGTDDSARGEAPDGSGGPAPRTLLVAALVLAGLVGVAWLGPDVADALTGHGEGTRVPSATVGYGYDRGTGTLTLVHRGGDEFVAENTGRLTVHVTDPGGETETHAVALPFGPCDAATVVAPPGSRVELVWYGPPGDPWDGPAGDRSAPVAAVEVPTTPGDRTTRPPCSLPPADGTDDGGDSAYWTPTGDGGESGPSGLSGW